jgi:hypothetical protein
MHSRVNSAPNDANDIDGEDCGSSAISRIADHCYLHERHPARTGVLIASLSSSSHWAKYIAILIELVECEDGKPIGQIRALIEQKQTRCLGQGLVLTVLVGMCAHRCIVRTAQQNSLDSLSVRGTY